MRHCVTAASAAANASSRSIRSGVQLSSFIASIVIVILIASPEISTRPSPLLHHKSMSARPSRKISSIGTRFEPGSGLASSSSSRSKGNSAAAAVAASIIATPAARYRLTLLPFDSRIDLLPLLAWQRPNRAPLDQWRRAHKRPIVSPRSDPPPSPALPAQRCADKSDIREAAGELRPVEQQRECKHAHACEADREIDILTCLRQRTRNCACA